MHKILFVATFGDFFSSFELNNIRIWQSLGCEVYCAANFIDREYNYHTGKLDTLKVQRFNVDFKRTPFSINTLKCYFQLSRIIRENHITVIDCHNPVPGVIARLVAFGNHVQPVIYTAHGFFFYRGAPLRNRLIYKPIEFLLARITDCLITINEEDYEMAKKMPVRGTVQHVHGVGVDINALQKLQLSMTVKRSDFDIPRKGIIFTLVGEMISRKNHQTAIKAFAQANINNSFLLIVGSGALRDQLISLCQRLGIQKKVVFTGFRNDVDQILNMSDVFVMPSFQEGLSVALLQSMVAGLPVIASRIRGNVDCILDHKGGYIVDPNDVDNMSLKMRKLASSPALCLSFGQFNTIEVRKFSDRVVKSEQTKIYKEILKGVKQNDGIA